MFAARCAACKIAEIATLLCVDYGKREGDIEKERVNLRKIFLLAFLFFFAENFFTVVSPAVVVVVVVGRCSENCSKLDTTKSS